MATDSATDGSITANDREILRSLAGALAEIAALPVQEEKAGLWRKLNDLQSSRPMVWINEIPWNEMNVDDELTLRCVGPWARSQEDRLRKILYQWRHMPADMVVSDYLPSPLAIQNSGVGLKEDADVLRIDETSSVASRRFRPQIVKPKDIEKIKMPVISHDEAATQANYRKMSDAYDGIMSVRKEGIKHIWYAPWDNLVQWWGVQEALTDLLLRPGMVNDAVARCAESMNRGLDQIEQLNLLSLGADNTRVGSGGYGYASSLPGEDFDPNRVKPMNNWGCSNAQIFSEVSPEMHWELALRHDIPWLQRWGLNCYGCCEPLHHKIDILRRIPRLRKVSMSPWIHPDKAVEAIGTDFVFSYKPNPAILAEDRWRPQQARKDLLGVLEKSRGCHVEVIMKDISTVRYQPRRLWEWQRIAMELVQHYSR
jgi:hypothetical protein